MSVRTPQFSLFFARGRKRSAAGQVIVEYAIVFPLQLMFTLAIVQLAHMFVARQILEYGAFCAARSAAVAESGVSHELIEENALRAAAFPISRVAGKSGYEYDDEAMTVPGWGPLDGSTAALNKTRVTISEEKIGGSTVIRCALRHDYELMVPMGSAVVYQVGQAFLTMSDVEADPDSTGLARPAIYGSEPHIMNFKASCEYVKLNE
jgi:TadE-like protein